MTVRTKWAAAALAGVLALAGCTGEEEPQVETSTGDDAAVDDDVASDAAAPDGEDAEDEPAAVDEERPADVTPAAGDGTATVEVDGQNFTFRVTQCLRDVESAMGGMVAFQLDGVPPDTADEFIAPLLGVIDADANVGELLEPVFEGGPILSVSRLPDGGELVAVSMSLTSAYVTSADVTSADARFLDISDAATGATVSGESAATGPDGDTVQLSIDADCP